MNYADIRPFDSANGDGIATTLFVSGCNFHCKGCFNEEAWDFNYGKPFTKEVEDKFIQYSKNSHVNHISILGGDPMWQDTKEMYDLLKRIKEEVNKPVWIWTGFSYEYLLNNKTNLLPYINILVDGKFDITKKDMNLKFKGSSNQRIINVQKSLKEDKIILYKSEDF